MLTTHLASRLLHTGKHSLIALMQVYSYNSNHLQIAAALAVAVTGLDIHQVHSTRFIRSCTSPC